MALLSASARAEIGSVVRTITKVETALEVRFQEHFVEAMGFPHTSDPYARLARVVALPAGSTTGSTGRARRRSRPAVNLEETS